MTCEPDEFVGHVTPDGGLRVKFRDDFQKHLNSLADEPVIITVRRMVTPEQRALWKGKVLPGYAEFLGYDKEEQRTLENHLLILFDNGWYVMKGGRMWPRQRISSFSRRKMKEFIDFVVRFAAKTHHYVITLPDEDRQK